MRMSLQEVAAVMNSDLIPPKITQRPFDHDPGHYWRLCNLQGRQPSSRDLVSYALDLQYMELQPELLRHLAPVLLAAWRRDLFEGEIAGYGGFAVQFWPALLKGAALQTTTSEIERNAIVAFMRDTILERIDSENSLRFSGMTASPYRWIENLVAYGVLFPDIENLWTEWWQARTPGHAVALFQYCSALLYESDENPVFDPWTQHIGGGPPLLWECGCYLHDVGWKKENLDFLNRTLSVEYVQRTLQFASTQIQGGTSKEVASRILTDLPRQKSLLSLRLHELPKLLKNLTLSNESYHS